MTCPITGTAEVQGDFDDDGNRVNLRWVHADAEIHVAVEMLDPDSVYAMDEQGRAFLLATYEIGEPCPHQPLARHARRKDQPGRSEKL